MLSFGATQITASAAGWTVIQGGNDGFLKWPKIAGREYAFTTQWTVAGGTPNTSAAGYLPFKVRLTPTAVPGGAAAKVELETFIAAAAPYGAVSYYYNQSPMSEWDTRYVTSMKKLFYNMTTFNADISLWNTSNVTSMTKMFWNCRAFDGDISLWDTSNVASMSQTFEWCLKFVSNLSQWNTANVVSMKQMFKDCWVFVGTGIEAWDTSSVVNMIGTFANCRLFNSPIGVAGGWDVGSVTDMHTMFMGALIFNQSLNLWNVSNVTNMQQYVPGRSRLQW